MNNAHYLAVLRRLGLTPHAKRTAALLGIGLRHAQRIAAGQAAVPAYAELLLCLYLRHGVPPRPFPDAPAETVWLPDSLPWGASEGPGFPR